MAQINPPQRTRQAAIKSGLLSALFAIAVITGGWLVVQRLNSDSSAISTAEPDVETAASDVILPAAKIATACFTTEPTSIRRIANVITVSGRLTYDESQHIEVQAPVSGVLVDVLVKPGDGVSKGQLLAVISSPEIGRARAAVLTEQANHDVILKQMERLRDITASLRQVFALLEQNTSLDELERDFNDRLLGSYREAVMAAYSERLLAREMAEAARPLAKTGAMPVQTLRERENRRHVAEAKYRAVLETTEFDTSIRIQQLEADRQDAQRRIMIAQNHLNTLLGIAETVAPAVSRESLSRMEIRAAFAGTIESRTYAKQERVQQSDPLFILANTATLYVSASIRENEWAAMSVQPGQELTITAPAIPHRSFTASVHYTGREVEIDSNALPLVATIANPDGLLRPGMFVRVAIPISQSAGVVAVPPAAVLQHDDEQFVFVAVNEDTFRRMDVQTGTGNEQWVEITDGLNPGQPVVIGGAFLLKSELLLAGEQ